MSYSFTLRAATRELVKEKLLAHLAYERNRQPAHCTDHDAIWIAATAYIDLLRDDPQQDVLVAVHGAVNGYWTGTCHSTLNSASVAVSVSSVLKQLPIHS